MAVRVVAQAKAVSEQEQGNRQDAFPYADRQTPARVAAFLDEELGITTLEDAFAAHAKRKKERGGWGKRARWLAHQGKIDPRRLVFIDETWIKTNMAPLRGRGLRGKRLDARAPHGHWKTLTLIAALRHDRVDAPCVIDGPINGNLFTAHVEQVLVPTLRPGDVVILDNLSSHKGRRARRAIRQAGAHLLFLPPCSPDLNPIEQLFAKLKHLLRAAEPRTVETTWRKAGAILDLVSPTECANCLVNSGYDSG